MTDLLGTFSEHQQSVCRHFPYPIAAAWQEALLATDEIQLEQRLFTVIEVTARVLGILAICDYLRGAVVLDVEPLLQGLDKPKPEHWAALCRAAAHAIAQRETPKPFCAELLTWALTPARDQLDGCARLEHVLGLRRDLLRRTGSDDTFDHEVRVEALCRTVLGLLQSLTWLALYRMMRVTALKTERDRTYSGCMQFFVGGAEFPEPLDAMWTAHLLLDVVYLCDARGANLLELSPFVRYLKHPRQRKTQCFLFEAARSMERLTLVHDTSGTRVETAIASPEGEISLDEWLSLRESHHAYHSNTDRAGTMRGDPGAAVRRPPSDATVRPIPDLSAAAFRQGRDATRRPSSALTPALLQRERWLTVAKVGIVLLMVVLWVRLLAAGKRTSVAPPLPAVAQAQTSTAVPVPAPVPVRVAVAAPARVPVPANTAAQPQSDLKFYDLAMAEHKLSPTYAVLKLEEAVEAGDARAAPALARLYATMGQGLRGHCARLALAALRDRPADAELLALARRCGADPSRVALADATEFPGGKGALTWKLLAEAAGTIYGDRLVPADRRRLAKDLYGDVAARGLVKGHLGLARIHLYGENNKQRCLDEALRAQVMGGAPTDRAEAAALIATCKPSP